jgi:predicted DNA-binding transcriptional regulator AlpA
MFTRLCIDFVVTPSPSGRRAKYSSASRGTADSSSFDGILQSASSSHSASRRCFSLAIRRREFPAQIRLTDGTVGWDSAEIENWIPRRKALRDRTNGKKATIPQGGNELHVIMAQNAGSAQPDGRPITGQPAAILAERQVTQLTGKELSKMRSGDARPFYDKLTGRLWMCVLQVYSPRSTSDN